MINHVFMATRTFNRCCNLEMNLFKCGYYIYQQLSQIYVISSLLITKNVMGIVRRISLIEFAVKGQHIRASATSAFVVNRNHHRSWSCQPSTVVGRWNDMIIGC